MNSAAAGLLVGLLALPTCGQEPAAKASNFYSLDREAKLGQEAAAGLVRSLPIVHERKLDAFIAKLASELKKHADPQFAYSFTLYDDRRPLVRPPVTMAMPVDALQGQATEPVAIASGPIFVPLSLLADAPDEAVFAFQLAHAMAHVTLRHSTVRATRHEISDLASAQPNVPNASIRTETAANQRSVMQLGLLRFSRQSELQADGVATNLVAAAGYDPEAVVRYLNSEPNGIPADEVWSAHPTAGKRVAVIIAAQEKLPRCVYRDETRTFDEIRRLAASVR